MVIGGLAAIGRGDYAAAEALLADALLKSPGEAQASGYLAIALASQADEDKQLQALQLARNTLEANPQNVEGASTLGWVEFRAGNLDEAERQLRRVASTGNLSRDAAYYLARVLYQRGQLAHAREFLRLAMEGNGLFVHFSEAAGLAEDVCGVW